MFANPRVGLLLLLPFLYAYPLAAQQAQQAAPLIPPGSGRIYLDVVVTAKSGPPVAGLSQQDFTLLDNKAPQAIASFQSFGGRDPVDVILVIDAVNTAFQNISYARDQVDKFLRIDGGHLAHPAALAFVTDTGTEMQDGFSSDGNELVASLDQHTVALRSIRRSAGFYGAAEKYQISLSALSSILAREVPRPGRKVIFWISPGWPLLSGPRIEIDPKQQQQIFGSIVSLSNLMTQARATLYSVDPLGTADTGLHAFYYMEFLKGVSEPKQALPGDLALQVLATQSGGLALTTNNDVTALLQKCLADTQAYYEISFDPPLTDQRTAYHHIEIRLADHKLTARTRQGYYTQSSAH
jgi:VWFA-related protein